LEYIKIWKSALAFQVVVQSGKFSESVHPKKPMTHTLFLSVISGLALSVMVGWSSISWSQDGGLRQNLRDRQALR
jgi:hypothetical protein